MLNQLYSSSKRIAKDDPPVVLDLPYDCKAVLAQILTQKAETIKVKNSLVTQDINEFVDISDDIYKNKLTLYPKHFKGLFTESFCLKVSYVR
jgi:hypothetical protein